MSVSSASPEAVATAAAQLAAGALVAFPTETVYGLGARADDDAAVAHIFAAKGRPAGHPLIVHVASVEQARQFAATWCDAAQRLTAAFWPGPLTVIVPRRPGLATAAAAGQDSIGLRVPAHPVALALLHAAARLGVLGVAAPSANRFGRVSPTLAVHVAQEFGDDLMVLDGGACAVGIESAIVDCTRTISGGLPALLRPGQLGRAALEAALGQTLVAPDARSPRASGTLASHYAPRAPVRLFDAVSLRHRLQAWQTQASGVVGVYSRVAPQLDLALAGWQFRPMPNDPAAVAHELFAVLREWDEAGVAAIWVEQPPPGPDWDGVRDRLQRAAA
jgi:L-threonylcarbamoyladenylate synthase